MPRRDPILEREAFQCLLNELVQEIVIGLHQALRNFVHFTVPVLFKMALREWIIDIVYVDVDQLLKLLFRLFWFNSLNVFVGKFRVIVLLLLILWSLLFRLLLVDHHRRQTHVNLDRV